ncbi:hypothetical protein H5410_019968 [Solanum commersonii]|uniref:Uncharacterized protein n=1 Tax=Solanum commersonii TaxID=4109 RepID=A0A9J5Z9V0_SOLCO|nr:hypothetical protein H5410_019968 [Solanum commersonii]
MELASRVLWDEKVPSKLRGKFCRVVVRQTLLYGAKSWSVKNSHFKEGSCRNEDVEIDVMCGHTKSDRLGVRISRTSIPTA